MADEELSELSPTAREHLHTAVIRDQSDRDAISSRLMRYRDGRGDDWADIIDMLTMQSGAPAASRAKLAPGKFSLSQDWGGI